MQHVTLTVIRCPCVNSCSPLPAVHAYDRIVYGSVEILATVQEGSKHALDSVVMLQGNEMYRAGRVRRFLSHTVPGCVADLEHDINTADVRRTSC